MQFIIHHYIIMKVSNLTSDMLFMHFSIFSSRVQIVKFTVTHNRVRMNITQNTAPQLRRLYDAVHVYYTPNNTFTCSIDLLYITKLHAG